MAKLYELLLSILHLLGTVALILGLVSEWGKRLVQEIVERISQFELATA